MKSNKLYFGIVNVSSDINIYVFRRKEYHYLISYRPYTKELYKYTEAYSYNQILKKGRLTKLTKAIYDIPDFEQAIKEKEV